MDPKTYFTGAAHGARVTSPYGMRNDPLNPGSQRMHYGIDFGGKPRGHVWTSPYPGTVTHTGTHGARGKVAVVKVKGRQILQLFQHLDEYQCKTGDEIEQGYPIGTNGTSGTLPNGKPSVTGPHLHYELRLDNGTQLGAPCWGNPAEFTLAKAGEEDNMQEYIVKNGDTLSTIASGSGIKDWHLLVEWNKDRYPDIGTGKNALVRVGWKLRLYDPAETAGVSRANFEALQKRVKALEDFQAKIKAL